MGLGSRDMAALVAFSASCGQAPCDRPLMSMRLRADDTSTKETWKANFKAIMENPGCCDEIWFSTFNAETGGKWTRETLGKAVAEDDGVCARWRASGTRCAAPRQSSSLSGPPARHT